MKIITKLSTAVVLSSIAAMSSFAAQAHHNYRSEKTNNTYNYNNSIWRLSPNNAYVGVQAGWAHYADGSEDFSDVFANSKTDTNGATAGAYVGYNFTANVAGEMGYEYLQGPKVNTSFISFPGASTINLQTKAHTNMMTFLARLNLPVTARITAFARGGMGVAWTSAKTTTNAGISVSETTSAVRPLLGGGLEYRVARQVAVNAQYMRLFGNSNVPSYDMVTGGVSYFFS